MTSASSETARTQPFSTPSDILNWAKHELGPNTATHNVHDVHEDAAVDCSTYSDTELVYRFLVGQTPVRPSARRATTRWEQLCSTFAIMEGSARKICTRHGFDPDEKIKRTR